MVHNSINYLHHGQSNHQSRKHYSSGTFFYDHRNGAIITLLCEGLGFTLINQWVPKDKIEWCWLQRGAGALMLQTLHKDLPERGLGVSVCFQCQDALALYHEFVEHDLKPNEPFVGNGLWVVMINDPDGYKLEFASPTDVPEETKYSEWKRNNNTLR